MPPAARCLPAKQVKANDFPLRLHMDFWATSRTTNHVAKILLEERLGYHDTKLLDASDLSADVYRPSATDRYIESGLGPNMAFEVWFDSGAPGTISPDYVLSYAFRGLYTRRTTLPRNGIMQFFDDWRIGAIAPLRNVTSGDADARRLCSGHYRTEQPAGHFGCDSDGIWRSQSCRHGAGSGICDIQVLSPLPYAMGDAVESIMEVFSRDMGIGISIAYVGSEGIEDNAYKVSLRPAGEEDILFVHFDPFDCLCGLNYPDHFAALELPSRGERRQLRQDYPFYGGSRLKKMMSSSAAAAPEAENAKAFFDAFELRLSDYEELAQWHGRFNGNSWSAACAWILGHQETWESWITFPSMPESFQENPWGGCWTPSHCEEIYGPCQAGSYRCDAEVALEAWWCFRIQFLVGICILLSRLPYPRWLTWGRGASPKMMPAASRHFIQGPGIDEDTPTRHSVVLGKLAHLENFVDPGFLENRQAHNSWVKANPLLDPDPLAVFSFCSHTRSLENFSRPNGHPELVKPPGSPLEVEGMYSSHIMRYHFILNSTSLRQTIFLSLGIGVVSGAVGNLMWCCEHYENAMHRLWGSENPTYRIYSEVVEPLGDAFGDLADEFKFFVTFAGLGLLGTFVSRWKSFFFAAWNIEGRMKDMSMILGSSVVTANERTTRKMFRCYRYLCAIMAVQYKTLLRPMQPAGADMAVTLGKLVELGLLTDEEKGLLLPSGSRVRDMLLSWLATEAKEQPEDGSFDATPFSQTFMEKLAQCRGQLMFFHGNNFFPISKLWISLVWFAVDAWVFFLSLGAPFKLYCPPSLSLPEGLLGIGGFAQLQTTLGTFLVITAFWGTLDICEILQKPFVHSIDTMNVDALCCGTEETLFSNLRIGLNRPKPEEPEISLQPTSQEAEPTTTKQQQESVPASL